MQHISRKDLEFIKDLATKAGKAIMKVYRTDFDVELKEDKSPLTKADKAANDIITAGLKKRFPRFSILSEESKDDLSRLENSYCFIVDPLDGTKEFINRNGEFTVNIALSYRGKPVLGVIAVPCTGELYYALENKGAYFQQYDELINLSVSNKKDNLNLVVSRSHPSEKLQKTMDLNKDKIGDISPMGSSLKGCLIASGDADIYYRFGYTMEWDTAAMHCIVEQAGGIFKNMDGTEMTYNRKDSLNRKGFYILNKENNRLKLP